MDWWAIASWLHMGRPRWGDDTGERAAGLEWICNKRIIIFSRSAPNSYLWCSLRSCKPTAFATSVRGYVGCTLIVDGSGTNKGVVWPKELWLAGLILAVRLSSSLKQANTGRWGIFLETGFARGRYLRSCDAATPSMYPRLISGNTSEQTDIIVTGTVCRLDHVAIRKSRFLVGTKNPSCHQQPREHNRV